MDFGCFVQLEGLRDRHEGLVHISQVNKKENFISQVFYQEIKLTQVQTSYLCSDPLGGGKKFLI